jgi:CDC45-like protein
MQSFFRYNGFKNPVGASDVVYATSSLLEMFSSSSSSSASGADGGDIGGVSTGGARTGGTGSKAEGVQRQAAFNKAYDCLSMQSESLLKEGVLAALSLQRVRAHPVTYMIYSYMRSFQFNSSPCLLDSSFLHMTKYCCTLLLLSCIPDCVLSTNNFSSTADDSQESGCDDRSTRITAEA